MAKSIRRADSDKRRLILGILSPTAGQLLELLEKNLRSQLDLEWHFRTIFKLGICHKIGC